VAVRSSAADEDSLNASFAGQYETYLNLVGVEAVAEAILSCWASARSPRALEYRRRQGLPITEVRLAVLVQQLVTADISAVVFSLNPVTGSRDEIVINAAWGLGDSIVSGQTTPDTYLVQRPNLTIISRVIAKKRMMTTPSASTGTTRVEVPADRRSQPVLSDDQALELARLALDLEVRMDWPVDLECVYQAGQLYLLQCRPVTTQVTEAGAIVRQARAAEATETDAVIKPAHAAEVKPIETEVEIAWQNPEDAKLTWRWSKMAFPEPLTPLMQSYLPYHTQGWARANRKQGTPGAVRTRFAHGYFYTIWEMVGLTTWEEAGAAWEKAERVTPARWAEEWLPEIKVTLERLRAIELTALANDDLARALQEALLVQIRHWEIHAHMGSSPLGAVQRLVDWYLERFPGTPESEPYRLVQGQLNTSLESGHALWQLSQMVTSAIAENLSAGAWTQLPEPFRAQFEAYLDRFGQRTQALADPASPTWREEPAPVARLILSYAKGQVADPYLELERLRGEREAFTAEVRAKLAADERDKFEQLLDCALANNPLTEDHAFWLDQQTVAIIRDICAQFEQRLVAAGAIDRRSDIAYLTLNELVLWGFGLADPLRPRITERKLEHARNRQISPPDFIGAPPEPQSWVDRFGGPAEPLAAAPGQIRGVGASAGLVRGPARVVRTLDEAQALRQGEILVCVATDPNWTPLFAVAAALVTDAGGSLSHAAVVAREYRLPAVVGTHTATRLIRTGQIIEVDGLNGVVQTRFP
jgi:pyruvate,water dikinase